ncbi:hypothetical protein BH23PAT2_BH23PAT2_05910 [soil metagenome]
MEKNHPIAILVRGLPGSGKTYIATKLQDKLGNDRVVMCDPDAIDTNTKEYRDHVKAQIAEGVDESLHLYRFSRARAYQGIEDNKIIMWNQPFTNLEIFNKMVGRLTDHAATHNKHLPILVVEVEIDPSKARARVEERKKAGGHGPSEETWKRFVNDYKSFATDGYNTVTAYGDDEVSVSVSKVEEALRELLNK